MLRQCLTCGVEFDGRRDSTLCPECAAKSKDSAVIRQRTCRACGATFLGGPRAWYCPECRRERQAEADRRHKRRVKSGLTRRLGTTDKCQRCGKEYVVNGGRQKYCPDCAEEAVREIDRKQSREWNAANIDYDSRRKDRQNSTAMIACEFCGKMFAPSSAATTCSAECSKLLSLQRRKKYEEDNRRKLSDYSRDHLRKKIAAMTSEEYRAYRDKVNARARELYQKRKEGKSGSDQ